MIQRIQTLYLLVAFAFCVGCLCLPIAHFFTGDGLSHVNTYAGFWDSYERVDMYNLWLVSEGRHMFYFCPVLMAILVITTSLIFIDVWLFKHRVLQMRVAIFSMILLVAWYIVYGIIIFLLYSTAGMIWSTHWTAAFPAVAFILLYLAFRGIMKDEKLVRSLDRLR
jgi:hypothetical protein